MTWRPLRVHAEREDSEEAVALLRNVERSLRTDGIATFAFEPSTRMGMTNVMCLIVRHPDGREHDRMIVPLYQGWPLEPDQRRLARHGAAVDRHAVADAVARIALTCADAKPPYSPADEHEALLRRRDAALDIGAALIASDDARLDAYRNADGHFEVDRADQDDGSVTTLILDPDMAGDDRLVGDILDDGTMERILGRDPFHLSLSSDGAKSRTWRIDVVGPTDGITVSSSECDAMEVVRRLHELA